MTTTSLEPPKDERSWSRVRSSVRAITAGTGAAVVALTGAFVTTPQAAAVTANGSGVEGAYGHVGSWIEPGYGAVFCLDSSLSVPFGQSPTSDQLVDYLPADSRVINSKDANSDDLGRMNFILSTWGNDDNDHVAAANVAAMAYVKTGGIEEALTFTGGNSYVNDLAWSMWQQSQNITVGGPGTGEGSGELYFDVNPSNNYLGTVTMVGTPGSTGSITLTNGVFTETGTATLEGAVEGVAYDVRGVPPEDSAEYKISGSGTFTAGGGEVWPGHLRVLTYDSSSQRMGQGVGPVSGSVTFEVWGEDPPVRSAAFQPVVTTEAVKFVQRGENFTDTITFSTTADENGLNNPWFQNPSTGEYAPVVAQGTVYGPFLSEPEEATAAPADAPVAGRATVTTGAEGPTINYTATSDAVSTEAGYYTWVWQIRYEDQPQRPTQLLLAEGYSFTDRFGQKVETSITPSGIIATSKVTKSEVALGEGVQDTLEVATQNGGWIENDNGPVPVTFRGTAYFVPGAEAPAVSDTVPAGTETIGSTLLTVDAPGSYTSAVVAGEDYRQGHITWVWEIRTEDQPEDVRGFVEEWSDQFGLAAETARVLVPFVETKAQTEVAQWTEFTDTAIVTGTLPAEGADLAFEVYAATKDEEGNWVCGEGNLLWTSEATRITETGEYVSPAAPGQDFGDYHWVETLTSVNGNEIHRGLCGLENETTTVVPPTVTTKAQTDVVAGDSFTDTAIVTGPVPADEANAYQLTFQLYKATKGTDGEWVCEAGNLLWTSEAVKVWETDGEYVSPAAPGQKAGDYHWVETLADRDGNEIHRGLCGLENETTNVEEPEEPTVPSLPMTGATMGALPWIGGGALAAGALLIAAAYYRHRRQTAQVAAGE